MVKPQQLVAQCCGKPERWTRGYKRGLGRTLSTFWYAVAQKVQERLGAHLVDVLVRGEADARVSSDHHLTDDLHAIITSQMTDRDHHLTDDLHAPPLRSAPLAVSHS